MKIRQLHDFIAIARCGGIRSAARELKLTQPALSKSIQQLEHELETPLFERHAHGSTLNAYGQAFLARAEAALHELRRGSEELQQLRGSMGGTVTVAASSVASLAFLPAALEAFRRRYPQAEVRVLDGTYPVILRGSLDGSLDFAIGPMPSPPMGDEFMVEELFQNVRCVVGRRNHPRQGARSLAELVDAQWIVTGAIGPHLDEFERIFLDHGLAVPACKLRIEALIGLFAVLANSDSLAILPHQWVDTSTTNQLLAKIKISQSIPGPSTCLIRRRGLPLTPAADALATAFRREATYYVKRYAVRVRGPGSRSVSIAGAPLRKKSP